MSEKKYKVSVIVPIYKAEKYIERCLNSVFNQDLDDVEYILINDATPDRSFEIARQVVAQSHRTNDVRLFENPQNMGIGKTRRKGMLAASAKYVIQIDADDWIEPNMLSQMYHIIEQEKTDVATCDYYISFLGGKKTYRKEYYQKSIDHNIKAIMLGKLHPSFWNTLIRREFYLEHDLMPTGEVNMGEDFETMFRVFLQTDKVSYLPQAFVYYTQYNTSSITKTMNASHVRDTIHSIKMFEKIMGSNAQKYQREFRIMLVFWKKMFLLQKEYTPYFYQVRPDANRFKYVFSSNGYGFFQKIAVSFSLLRMPLVTRFIYKTYRYFKTKF